MEIWLANATFVKNTFLFSRSYDIRVNYYWNSIENKRSNRKINTKCKDQNFQSQYIMLRTNTKSEIPPANGLIQARNRRYRSLIYILICFQCHDLLYIRPIHSLSPGIRESGVFM